RRSPRGHPSADGGARPGHRPARSGRHGPVGTAGRVLDATTPPGWARQVPSEPRENEGIMKKTLGAVALLGATALALAGCAGTSGGGSTEETGAEIRVWLNGTDTPQEARDYLKETFEEENPGNTLVIEEQSWEGLVDKLTTSLSSSDSPDIVEIGNTQSPAFTSVGALLDISDMYETLGGDDLLPGFVEAGSYNEAFYAPPLYSGARVVFADPALVTAAPATLDDYVTLAKDLAADN